MLKGQAKKDYQRRYMREYMQDYRLKRQVVKTPEIDPVQPGAIFGGYIEDDDTIKQPKATSPPYQSNSVQPKTRDEALQTGRERMANGHIPVIEIDADGNPIYNE